MHQRGDPEVMAAAGSLLHLTNARTMNSQTINVDGGSSGIRERR